MECKDFHHTTVTNVVLRTAAHRDDASPPSRFSIVSWC